MSAVGVLQTASLVALAIIVGLALVHSRRAAGRARRAAWQTDQRRWRLTQAMHQSELDPRCMLLLLRLEWHELTFLAHADSLSSDDVWSGFRKVIEQDAALPDFGAVWEAASQTYSERFRDYVNDVIDAGPGQ